MDEDWGLVGTVVRCMGMGWGWEKIYCGWSGMGLIFTTVSHFEPPSEVWTKPRGRPRNSWVRTVTNDLANSYTGLPEAREALRTGSTGGCLRSIAQRTCSGACWYWIGHTVLYSQFNCLRIQWAALQKWQNMFSSIVHSCNVWLIDLSMHPVTDVTALFSDCLIRSLCQTSRVTTWSQYWWRCLGYCYSQWHSLRRRPQEQRHTEVQCQ